MPHINRRIHCPACGLSYLEDDDGHTTQNDCREALAEATASANAYWDARTKKQRQEDAQELAAIEKRRKQLLAAQR